MNKPELRYTGDLLVPLPTKPIRVLRFAAGNDNRLRRWVFGLFVRLMAPPYLPGPLALFATLLALSAGLFLLMQQRPEYWSARANLFVADPNFNALLSAGPLAFLAMVLAYTVAFALALLLLNRGLALVIWFGASLYHLGMIASLSNCGFRGIYLVKTNAACAAFNLPVLALLGLSFGLAVSGMAALLYAQAEPDYRAEEEPAEVPAGFPAGLPVRVRRAPGSLIAALVIVTAWLVFTAVGTTRNAAAPQPAWRPVQSVHAPPGRSAPGFAYDTRRGQAVLFGGAIHWDSASLWIGMDDTWVWDGQDWIEQRLSASPPARSDAAMAYDAKRGVVVLFGGQDRGVGLGDTWEWDGARWIERNLPEKPPARCSARLVYDPERQKLVLYSGFVPSRTPPKMENVFYKDAWEYDGQTWKEIHLDGGRDTTNYAIVANPLQGGLLMVNNDGLWNWTDGGLRLSRLDSLPGGRSGAALAYDPLQKLIFLYGGVVNDRENGETWRFDGESWERIYPAQSPIVEKTHYRAQALFFDQTRQKMLLFTSGMDDSYGAFTAGTWELALP